MHTTTGMLHYKQFRASKGTFVSLEWIRKIPRVVQQSADTNKFEGNFFQWELKGALLKIFEVRKDNGKLQLRSQGPLRVPIAIFPLSEVS